MATSHSAHREESSWSRVGERRRKKSFQQYLDKSTKMCGSQKEFFKIEGVQRRKMESGSELDVEEENERQ